MQIKVWILQQQKKNKNVQLASKVPKRMSIHKRVLHKPVTLKNTSTMCVYI